MVTQAMIEYLYRMFFYRPTKHSSFADDKIPPALIPTQSDKPSPTSHFTVTELYRRKLKEYPRSQGYIVHTVSNTNSMEALIDDNTVITAAYYGNEAGRKHKIKSPLRIGDMCVYEGDPRIWGWSNEEKKRKVRIVHVIIESRTINGDREFRFQGYNNFRADPGWVREEAIVSKCFDWVNAQQLRFGD